MVQSRLPDRRGGAGRDRSCPRPCGTTTSYAHAPPRPQIWARWPVDPQSARPAEPARFRRRRRSLSMTNPCPWVLSAQAATSSMTWSRPRRPGPCPHPRGATRCRATLLQAEPACGRKGRRRPTTRHRTCRPPTASAIPTPSTFRGGSAPDDPSDEGLASWPAGWDWAVCSAAGAEFSKGARLSRGARSWAGPANLT